MSVELYQEHYLKVTSFAPRATALVSTRLGGRSQAPFDAFNLAHHVGDELSIVLENREHARQSLGAQELFFMDQIHSSTVVTLGRDEQGHVFTDGTLSSKAPSTIADCDALVTREKGLGLAVMTADCLPLLLCDTHAGIIAAVHCGWRGLHKNIIERTLKQMERLGAHSSHIAAFMGPAIGPQSFEIGKEVKDAFVASDAALAQAFVPRAGLHEKFLGNMYAICCHKLHVRGVEKVEGGCYDTFTQDDLFYSYRKHHETGRLASMICLQE